MTLETSGFYENVCQTKRAVLGKFSSAGLHAKPRKQMTLKRPFLNEFRLNFFSMISTHFEEFNYHIDFSVESLYFLIS